MNNRWLDEVKNALEVESHRDSGARFDRLKELGIIDEHGDVTGHIHRWNAFLAITEVKHAAGTGKIASFRCLKPVFGMPGAATIDISRDSMVDYLSQGKTVITAKRDERLDMWKEGCGVHLSAKGFVRADTSDDPEDNVGNVAEFDQSTSQL